MTVIRDAVIRIRTERSGSVGGGYESRAFAAEARAAREAAQEIEGANRGLSRHTENVGRFGVESLKAYAKAGQGALQLARSVALLAVSNEDDAQRIIKGLVQIEAVVHGVSGAYKLLTSTALAGMVAALNPATASLVVIGGLLVAGKTAWDYWADSAEDAAKRAEEAVEKTTQKYLGLLDKVNQIRQAELSRRTADEGFAAESAVTPEARRRALENRRSAIEGELAANEQRRSGLEGMNLTGAQVSVLAGAEKEALGLIQERARIERDLLDLRTQERQEELVKRQGFGRGISDLFGGAVGSAVSDLEKRTADADIKKFEQEAQVTIDKLNKIFEEVNSTLGKHERDLRQLER